MKWFKMIINLFKKEERNYSRPNFKYILGLRINEDHLKKIKEAKTANRF